MFFPISPLLGIVWENFVFFSLFEFDTPIIHQTFPNPYARQPITHIKWNSNAYVCIEYLRWNSACNSRQVQSVWYRPWRNYLITTAAIGFMSAVIVHTWAMRVSEIFSDHAGAAAARPALQTLGAEAPHGKKHVLADLSICCSGRSSPLGAGDWTVRMSDPPLFAQVAAGGVCHSFEYIHTCVVMIRWRRREVPEKCFDRVCSGYVSLCIRFHVIVWRIFSDLLYTSIRMVVIASAVLHLAFSPASYDAYTSAIKAST